MKKIFFLSIQPLRSKSESPKTRKLRTHVACFSLFPLQKTTHFTLKLVAPMGPTCADWRSPVSCSSPAAAWFSPCTSSHPPQSSHPGGLQWWSRQHDPRCVLKERVTTPISSYIKFYKVWQLVVEFRSQYLISCFHMTSVGFPSLWNDCLVLLFIFRNIWLKYYLVPWRQRGSGW